MPRCWRQVGPSSVRGAPWSVRWGRPATVPKAWRLLPFLKISGKVCQRPQLHRQRHRLGITPGSAAQRPADALGNAAGAQLASDCHKVWRHPHRIAFTAWDFSSFHLLLLTFRLACALLRHHATAPALGLAIQLPNLAPLPAAADTTTICCRMNSRHAGGSARLRLDPSETK